MVQSKTPITKKRVYGQLGSFEKTQSLPTFTIKTSRENFIGMSQYK